jgi:hypothetical protein
MVGGNGMPDPLRHPSFYPGTKYLVGQPLVPAGNGFNRGQHLQYPHLSGRALYHSHQSGIDWHHRSPGLCHPTLPCIPEGDRFLSSPPGNVGLPGGNPRPSFPWQLDGTYPAPFWKRRSPDAGLVSALSFAVYTLLVRKKPAGISALSFLWTIFLLGTLFLVPFYLKEARYHEPLHWSLRLLYIILYLGIGNSILAFFCWNASIRLLGPSGTALFGNLIPIFSSIEAVLILGEQFSYAHLASAVLVVGGLLVANLPFRSKPGTGSEKL